VGHVSSGYSDEDGPPAVGKAVARLAEHQHGVVSTDQLRSLGLDASAVYRLSAAGWLHSLHRGVYAVGHVKLTVGGRYMAAVLACGSDAALSHRSAADLWNLRRSRGQIEVTVPRGRAGASGLRVHRCRSSSPADFTSIEGIRVTSVARTLLDVAAVLRPKDLEFAIDRAERSELFDLAAIDDVLTRARGRKGAKALRRAVASYRPTRTRSELERRFEDLIRSSNLPLPQFNVLLEGHQYTHEVDAHWPAHKLVVELDGFEFHRTRRDREKDASKDADLELAGLRVMRLTWDQVTLEARSTTRRLQALVSKS
jgi:very-short-patch-repair endonuclease